MNADQSPKWILAINPGSTSTKIGVFAGSQELFQNKIKHESSELEPFPNIVSQYEMRKNAILFTLEQQQFDIAKLDAIAARGAPIGPLKGGAYLINKKMVDFLNSDKAIEHASNLAALIAYEIAQKQQIPAFIYDAISTDELDDVARISGMPAIPRESLVHALNMRAVCHKVSEKIGRPYAMLKFIVAHLGGGTTISVHRDGRMVDILSDDEGPFSAERAGRVPCRRLIDLCYSGNLIMPPCARCSGEGWSCSLHRHKRRD